MKFNRCQPQPGVTPIGDIHSYRGAEGMGRFVNTHEKKSPFHSLSGAFSLILVALLAVCVKVTAAQRQVLGSHTPSAVKTLNLKSVDRLVGSKRLQLAIGLPFRNQEALTNLLHQIYDPTSPNYRHYLTPELFTELFGPTEQDYQAVITFAKSNGFKVTSMHPNRVVLDVEGAVADIEKTLHITMRVYQHPTEARTFYAPEGKPSLDLAVPILDISGLSDYGRPHPNYILKPANLVPMVTPNSGSGPGGNYMGHDFRAAYVPGTLLTGAGQVIALVQFDGYLASDIAAYESQAGLASVTLTNVLLDGFNGSPTGNGGEVEVSLDIEMVVSMAPGLSEVIVYEGNPNNFIPNDVLNRIATDNSARQISCSWGWSGGPSATTDQIFQQMAAHGQSFFAASGDSDSYADGAVDNPALFGYPADSPNITSVGGTVLTTGAGGAYVSETVWNTRSWDTSRRAYIGTSGGISSSQYPIPTWQQGVSMAANGGSTTYRNFPDVALIAADIYVIADNGTAYTGVGGTSCAAPLWAGFTALVNQQGAANGVAPVGFLNPTIYTIGTHGSYTSAFHDITTGDNASPDLRNPYGSSNQFYAVTGYDLCTGWGTPLGTNLINALTGPVISVPNLVAGGSVVNGGNGNGTIDRNECNLLNLVIHNIGTATATTINATLTTTTPGLAVIQSSSTYPDLAPGAMATNSVPFQISTSPAFACGTPVNLTLTLVYGSGTNIISFSLASGGADYIIIQSSGATIVPGTADIGNHGDDVTTAISLPFAYAFYGQTFSNATVSANGNLQFVGAVNNPANACLPVSGFTNSIFAFWDDLRTDGTTGPAQGIYTSTSGSSPNRIFNIEWRASYYSHSGHGNPVNFEIRLYENQPRVDIVYGTLNGSGASATVGAQKEPGGAFTQFECNSGGLGSGLQLSFQTICADGGGSCAPSAVNFTGSPTNGTAPLAVSFTNSGSGATSYSWDFGDGNNSTNEYPTNTYTNAGSYSVTLTVVGPGGSNSLTRTNYITVVNPGQLVVTPQGLDFGLIATGATAQAALIVSNAGFATLDGSATIGGSGPFVILSGNAFSLGESDSTNLVIGFAPQTEGVFSNVVIFASNGGNSTNTLAGRAIGAPLIQSPSVDNTDFIFSFATTPGFTYTVQFKDSLGDPVWQTLQSVAGDGTSKMITVQISTASQRFYRLLVE